VEQDIELRVGTRIRLIRDVERFPFFIATAGLEGVITENSAEKIAAKMDRKLGGAEAWNNEIHWETDFNADEFVDDVQLIESAETVQEREYKRLYLQAVAERDALQAIVNNLLRKDK